jgi:Zn-dependent protease with chaperone function
MAKYFSTTAYRTPNEILILSLTLFLVLLVIVVTASATFCASFVFIAIAVGMAYFSSRTQHQQLIQQAYRVNKQETPEPAELVRQCALRLQPENFEVYIARSKALNAYTFGLTDPKVVVLYSALFQIMDEQEMRFILGHEFGHIRLGHTRLNSLVGGMAGIPSSSSVSAILMMAFLWWNRACEDSADRAGLLACGNPNKAVSALVKLVAGPSALTSQGMAMAYQQLDAQDDTLMGNLSEMLASHPLIINRIEKIRAYAKTDEYRQLQVQVDQNVRLG